MMKLQTLGASLLVLLGSALAAASIGACRTDRDGFEERDEKFDPDASVDAVECLLQCSLDGRSVIRTCDGTIANTCPPELACGAGVCQEPCAAAAADRSSNGCEFYFQPPRFTKFYQQACYAVYVVNTSNQPLDVALELGGKPLDVSRSIYETKPGDPTLIPHAGPLAAGESAILFVSDQPPDSTAVGEGRSPCPVGVVPATYEDALPDRTGLGSAFHVTTNVPANLSAIYPMGAYSHTPTATLLFPVPTWGTEHILVNAWSRNGESSGGPAAQIVAAEDGTDITIFPTRAIQDGAGVTGTAAHVAATYRLDKGQVLQINQREELSGSIVTSNKPTSIFGGHECMNVPAS
ncbi:MAG: IgGFc-binding protein, partial [Myxococcales bacterium]|nr:IgGFc-binding protein [Myxococcales bacterium]